jgi:transposase
MRGADRQQAALFSYVSCDARVPADHPLRVVRALVDEALAALSPRFASLYAATGRPSIPPEQLLRALLLQVLYTIRSERQLMEQLDYNLLFRWFVGLELDDPIWVPTVFTKNRERLVAGAIADAFLPQVLVAAEQRGLLSHEHFSVDGTLLEAAASLKSLQPREGPPPPRDDDPGNPSVDFHGTPRTNATHRSTTAPEARLAAKGQRQAAKLSYVGSVLLDNRHGLVVGAQVDLATGTAEREAAGELLQGLPPRAGRRTLGADKAYDTQAFVATVRTLGGTPHVAQHISARHPSAIDARTTRHAGYAVSQRVRKRIEEVFGWAKTIGLLRKLRHRGRERIDWIFTFTQAAYNLVRLRTLITGGAAPA